MNARKIPGKRGDLKTPTEERTEEIHRSSTGALRMVYYVIIGLAITEALTKTFSKNGEFLGSKVFSPEHLTKVLVLFAFLPTIGRFLHGASVQLAKLSHKGAKPLVDIIQFLFQGCVFYLMAISLNRPSLFILLFILMLLGDLFWLIFSWARHYIGWARTEKQWLWSDIGLIVVFILLYLMRGSIGTTILVFTLLAVTSLTAFLDYWLNKDFYFPQNPSKTSDKLD